jgi:predicted DNA-binding protein (UPF0251 family)
MLLEKKKRLLGSKMKKSSNFILLDFKIMARPRRFKRICFNPSVDYFKPRGIPLNSLKVVELSFEEMETLRLKDVRKMDQIDAAKEMNTSQSTFQRILSSAREKVSFALVNGYAIKIIKE